MPMPVDASFCRMSSKEAFAYIQTHLPEVNRKNFLLFLQFLGKIVDSSPTSKMSPENLTVTLYMNLFRRGY